MFSLRNPRSLRSRLRRATEPLKPRYEQATEACKDTIRSITLRVLKYTKWKQQQDPWAQFEVRDINAVSPEAQDTGDDWDPSNVRKREVFDLNDTGVAPTNVFKADYDLGLQLNNNLRHMKVHTGIARRLLKRACKLFQTTVWELAREHWPVLFEDEFKDGYFMVGMTRGEIDDWCRYLEDEKLRMVCPDNKRRRHLYDELLKGPYGLGVYDARNTFSHPRALRNLRNAADVDRNLRKLQEAVLLFGDIPRSQQIRAMRDDLAAELQRSGRDSRRLINSSPLVRRSGRTT
ncbi:hypothetical protein V8F20_006903 [Naviculisporaceae sp. PSN 640]